MALPPNLLPVNASSIAQNSQTLLGQLPSMPTIPEIPQVGILNTAIPDSLFQTGSIEEIEKRALGTAEAFLKTFAMQIPIPALPPELLIGLTAVRSIPSYGQVKNFIKTKVDRIKAQKQQASIKALREDLKKQQNPFEQRQNLKNIELRSTIQQVINNRG